VQGLIDDGRRAHAAGRLDDARMLLVQALDRSPGSTVILHELSLVEQEAGRLEAAEQHARQAIALEPTEPEWLATLGGILEGQGRFREAAEAFAGAAALDARAEWRTRSAELRRRADLATLPPEFGSIASAARVSRAQAAAFVGVRLEDLVRAAPTRVTDIATDVRTHWAASWILPVTRAGIMTLFPNHTFQPAATVTRGELAAVAAELLRLAASPADLGRWQAARPRFADLPPTHVTYRTAALAVASGAMAADADGRFQSIQPASGPDLEALVRRIEALARP
jgi:tetratricopeptide (TPR) repeat protein